MTDKPHDLEAFRRRLAHAVGNPKTRPSIGDIARGFDRYAESRAAEHASARAAAHDAEQTAIDAAIDLDALFGRTVREPPKVDRLGELEEQRDEARRRLVDQELTARRMYADAVKERDAARRELAAAERIAKDLRNELAGVTRELARANARFDELARVTSERITRLERQHARATVGTFDDEFLVKLIRLCHPDRHSEDLAELATAVTAKLNVTRKPV